MGFLFFFPSVKKNLVPDRRRFDRPKGWAINPEKDAKVGTPPGKEKTKRNNCTTKYGVFPTELKLQELDRLTDHDSWADHHPIRFRKLQGPGVYLVAMWVKGEPALEKSMTVGFWSIRVPCGPLNDSPKRTGRSRLPVLVELAITLGQDG
jgi:hypothetical protein